MKRALKLKLLFVALLCVAVQGAWAQNYDVWDGKTTTRPGVSAIQGVGNFDNLGTVEINTAAELAWLMSNFNDEGRVEDWRGYGAIVLESNINLNADIDMTAGIWTPFDTYPQKVWHHKDYNVTFNGNGHTIRIRIDNGTSDNNQGLFKEISEYGTVKNLHVE